MLPDPLTLGITAHLNAFTKVEDGPGSRTKRVTTTASLSGAGYYYDNATLTISHEVSKAGRRRSVLRVEYPSSTKASDGSAGVIRPPAAYIVLDSPVEALAGDTLLASKELLARILGFLSENATGAPDFTFATNENVLAWLRGEP